MQKLIMGKKDETNGKNDETKEKRPQFNWSDEMEYAFIQAMITQQNKGNRPGGNFSSEAYTNMVNELRQN